MIIDKNKQYRTRDGREVRIYATDGFAPFSVHGAIKTSEGWLISNWDKNGLYWRGQSDHDVIEVKPRIKRTVWVNLVKDSYGEIVVSTYTSKESADRHHYDRRIACVKVEIDCEEGEGL